MRRSALGAIAGAAAAVGVAVAATCAGPVACGSAFTVADGGSGDATTDGDTGASSGGLGDATSPDAPCMPQGDHSFCRDHSIDCGPLTGLDNCGTMRTTMCGPCDPSEYCTDAGKCAGCCALCAAQAAADCVSTDMLTYTSCFDGGVCVPSMAPCPMSGACWCCTAL